MKTTAVNLERFNLCIISKDAAKNLKGGDDTVTNTTDTDTTPEIVIEEEVDI